MSTLVVIPTLNEADHIGRVLDELLVDPPAEGLQIVVVDGGSTDGTQALAAQRAGVEVLHNPERVQAAAVNLAVEKLGDDHDVLVRVDCHSSYPPGFVRTVATTLRQRRPEGCVSVVVPMHTVGTTTVQVAIAATQNSLIGNGGSPHRGGGTSRYLDHGHHAAMDIAAFRAVGGYDRTMAANEDAELDARLVAAGGRIYLDADAEIVYYPRTTWKGLARQYYRYGLGRAATTIRHHVRPKPRQVLPAAITAVNATALVLAARRPLALVVPATYAGACVCASGYEARKASDARLLLIAPAAMIQHHTWGCGFLIGLARGIRQGH